MKRIPVQIALILLLGNSAFAQLDVYDSIYFGGRWRTFLTHLPKDYSDKATYPLVFAFHGGSPLGYQSIQYQSRLSLKADSAGFIVVYPEGVKVAGNRTWNAGGCCSPATTLNIDDVGFTAALLDKLIAIRPIKKALVYATGFSNGALLCYRLANQLSNRFAAIAPVEGDLMYFPWSPSRAVPIISFHSYLDKNIPYNGGVTIGTTGTYFPPQDSIFGVISSKYQCSVLKEVVFHNTNQYDHFKYSTCIENVIIEQYVSYDGEHSWPGGLATGGVKVSNQFSATFLMWKFFQNYQLGAKSSQSITFQAIPPLTFATPFLSLSASASSNLPILFTSSDPAVASVDGNRLTILKAGTTTITASQAGNDIFESAANVQQLVTINKATPSISWSNPADIVYGTSLSSVQLNATSSVDGTFAYTPVSGTKLNAGSNQNLSVTLTPTDVGNYNSATKLVSINVTKFQQQITFSALADKTIGDGAFNLTASANSTLPVSYSTSSDKISINDKVVTLLKAGRVSITAGQVGNDNYNAASSVTQSFCIKPAKPTITVSTLTSATPLLISSAASGNQWYVDGTAIAGATNATFSATKSGNYKVQVMVDDCTGEFSVEQPLVITGIEAIDFPIDLYPNPVSDGLTISFEGMEGRKLVTVYALTGESLVTSNTESGSISIDVSELSVGIYLAKVIAGDAVQTKKFNKQ